MRNVSRYNSLGGYVEDLAELINGRFGHACGSYFDSNNQMVNLNSESYELLFKRVMNQRIDRF